MINQNLEFFGIVKELNTLFVLFASFWNDVSHHQSICTPQKKVHDMQISLEKNIFIKMPTNHIFMAWALFRSEKNSDFEIVAISFLFDKHCPIIQ